MEDIRSYYLRHLQGRLGQIAVELTRVRYSSSAAAAWHPAINAYRCRDGFVICVDLAGVERSEINLTVEPTRVLIRGQRPAPEPDATPGPAVQILALEIDHGPFEREVVLPAEVDPEQAQAEQRNGLLWIFLPLRPTECP
jgi:HSP20 family protein